MDKAQMIKEIMKKQDKESLKEEFRQFKMDVKSIEKAYERRIAGLDKDSVFYKVEKFKEDYEVFKQEPKLSLAVKLIQELQSIDLPTITQKTDGEYREKDIHADLQPLFDFLLERKDIKLIEKYFISRMGYTQDQADILDIKVVRPYLKHIKEEGPHFTDKSSIVLSTSYPKKYELYHFMRLLAEMDYKAKPEGTEGVYQSPRTKKHILRIACGIYGDPYDYVYYDGKYGHQDSLRDAMISVHKIGYEELEKQESVQES